MEMLNGGQKQQLERYISGRETESRGKLKIAWFGRSNYHAKDRVKSICRGDPDGPNYTAYDPENKWWGTKSLAIVPKLIDSGLWTPVGISEDLISYLHMEASRLSREEEASRKEEEGVSAEKDTAESDPPPPKRVKVEEVDRSKMFVYTFYRQCPVCHTIPIEQFFECSCCDVDCHLWERCEICRCIHNPPKLKRLDNGELDEQIDPKQISIIRAGLACMC